MEVGLGALGRNGLLGALLLALGRCDWQGMDQFAFANSHSVVRGLKPWAGILAK